MQEDLNNNAKGTKHTWEGGQKNTLRNKLSTNAKNVDHQQKKFMQQHEDLDDNPRGIDQQFEKAKQQCKKTL
jgi:hypothetical protein